MDRRLGDIGRRAEVETALYHNDLMCRVQGREYLLDNRL
jgi:hypothetical protein